MCRSARLEAASLGATRSGGFRRRAAVRFWRSRLSTAARPSASMRLWPPRSRAVIRGLATRASPRASSAGVESLFARKSRVVSVRLPCGGAPVSASASACAPAFRSKLLASERRRSRLRRRQSRQCA